MLRSKFKIEAELKAFDKQYASHPFATPSSSEHQLLREGRGESIHRYHKDLLNLIYIYNMQNLTNTNKQQSRNINQS